MVWFFRKTSFLNFSFVVFGFFSKKSLFQVLLGWNLWSWSDKSKVLIMQLNNAILIGLCGVLMLLQLINCMELEAKFMTACVLLVLSDYDQKKQNKTLPKLIRINPMVTFTNTQFKKKICFSKADTPWSMFAVASIFLSYWWYGCRWSDLPLMVLFRFAFPTTMHKLQVVFGYPYSTYSKIVNYGLSLLYAKFGGRLEQFMVDLVLHNCRNIRT